MATELTYKFKPAIWTSLNPVIIFILLNTGNSAQTNISLKTNKLNDDKQSRVIKSKIKYTCSLIQIGAGIDEIYKGSY